MILFLVSSTGQSLRTIKSEWDLPRLQEWIEYCNDHPPVQAMVAAYLGVGKKGGKGPSFRLTEENFAQFMSMVSADSKMM